MERKISTYDVQAWFYWPKISNISLTGPVRLQTGQNRSKKIEFGEFNIFYLKYGKKINFDWKISAEFQPNRSYPSQPPKKPGTDFDNPAYREAMCYFVACDYRLARRSVGLRRAERDMCHNIFFCERWSMDIKLIQRPANSISFT